MIPRTPAAVRRAFALLVCVTGLLTAISSFAAEAKKSFDIPAGKAPAMLKQFTAQSEEQLLFSADEVEGIATNGVKGSYTAQEALTRMVDGTTLTVVADKKNGALSLVRNSDPNAPRAARPSAPARTAQKAAEKAGERMEPERPAGQTSDQKEEVLELSPFEVVANTKGYYSANTMSGTRLNSPMEDLGASISVITKQQMEDLALLDINDVFLYMGNTEGTGQYTDLGGESAGSNITDSTANDPTNANRVRGISRANVSSGNFETSNRVPLSPLDSDGVEISRGPNASIFGLGNPSGTVNIIGATANLQRDKSTVIFRADSFEGWSSSLDLNRVLVKDRLAIRVSGSKEHTGFDLKPSGVDAERFNGMLTFKPFKKTLIRASYQYYHAQGSRPNSAPPQDGISAWRADGSQTWDPLTSSLHDANGVTTRTTLPSYLYRPTSNLGVQYVDQDGIGFWGQFFGAVGGTSPYGTPFNRLGTLQSSRGIVMTVPSFQDTQPLIGRRVTVVTDRSLYDWKSQNLYTPNSFEDKTETSRVTIDQTVFETPRQMLAAQFGWFREDSERFQRYIMADGSTQGLTGILAVDINERLLDGRSNPYFMRPYIFQAEPRVRDFPLRNDNYRTQAAYKLDFSRDEGWRKWLGTHNLVGYGEYKEKDQKILTDAEQIVSRNSWQFPNATSNRTAGQPVRAFYLYYLGDNVGQNIEYGPGPADYGDYTYTFGDAITGVFQNEPVTLGRVPINYGGTHVIQKTKGAVLQSYLFKGRIVTTFGKRQDDHFTKVYNNMALPSSFSDRGFGRNLDFLNQFTGATQMRNGSAIQKGVVVKPFRGWDFIDRPASQGAGFTRFFAQALQGLNVHYNKSDSFLPASPAQNVFGEWLPDPRGDGKDYGFSLSLFDGKLYLKVNKYSTETLNSREGPSRLIANNALGLDYGANAGGVFYGLSVKAFEWITAANPGITLDQALAQMTTLIGVAPILREDLNEFAAIPKTETDDMLSRGHEIELHYNPVPYWTLTANFTEMETINTRLGVNVGRYVEQRLPYWTTIVDPSPINPNSNLWFDQKYTVNGTPRQFYELSVLNALKVAQALEGHSRPQIRRYRAVLATTFYLRGISGNKILRGIGLTGAARYESKSSIGFLGDPDPDGIYRTFDVNRSIYDKGHIYADAGIAYRTKLWRNKVGATFQFNVRNLNENGRLQPISALVTGTIYQYRIVSPRQFFLTATFDL